MCLCTHAHACGAEALCPTKLGMALSETRYYKRSELDVFHHKSKHFIFPLKVPLRTHC